MSGPNTNYDPVEVTPLSPDEVARMRDEALAAIAAAQTLDELKEARIAHAGDKAPLTLANSRDRRAAAAGPRRRRQAGGRGPRRGQAGPRRPAPPRSRRTATGGCCSPRPST